MLQTSTPQGAGSPAPGLQLPSPPPANRLNKLALVVVAVVMGATLLAMALMAGNESKTSNRDDSAQSHAESGPSRSAHPSFLERPPQEPSGEAALDPFTGLPVSDGTRHGPAEAGALVPPVYTVNGSTSSNPAYGAAPPEAADPYGQIYAQPTTAYPDPYGSAYSQASAAEARSPEEESLDRALRSALSPQRGSGGGRADVASRLEEGQEPGGEAELYREAHRMIASLSRANGLGNAPAAAGAQLEPGAAVEVNGERDHHARFRQAATASRHDSGNYISAAIERPLSPFELREGTLLEAFLVTGMNSELPGEVVAQVSRNVYDSQTQQALLIPKGSRLIGTYDNQVALDQSRLLVAWTRLIFPDGRSVNLPGLNSMDVQGATGLTGQVNRHLGRAFGRALMLSVVGAGFQLSQPRPRVGYNAYPTPGEIAAGAVGTELSRVATELLRRDMNVRPTIKVREGTPFNVFLNGDLALGPYQPEDVFLRTRRANKGRGGDPQLLVQTPLN